MKIDYIITNPPYNKTLYLEILEYLIKNCSESEIVSVNPNQHLTDVISSSGFRKKRNIFKKYEESVYKHIKDKKYYNREEFEKLFNIEYAGSGAIYHISPKGKFSVYKTAFQETNKNGFVVHSVLIKILNKVVSEDVLSKHYKFHEKGNLIAVGEVCRAFEHGNLLYEKHKKVYNSKNEYFNNYGGNNLENKKDEGRRFINFNTSEEAQNFITCFDTEFMKFFMRSTHNDVAPLFNFIPLLDMTQKWTNEKLCEYYNVSKEEFNACLEWYNS